MRMRGGAALLVLALAGCGSRRPGASSSDSFCAGEAARARLQSGSSHSGGTHGTFVLVGAGVTDTTAAGTMRLETTRSRYVELVSAFPNPR